MAAGALAFSIGLAGCATDTSHHDADVAHEHAEGDIHAHEHGDAAAGAMASDAGALSGDVVDGVREVEVEAFRYGYEPDPIVVKKGERVRLIAKSRDVTHGLGIEDLDIDIELSPKEERTVEFTPEKAGEFHIHCTVYCGSGHSGMHGTLQVID
jgi:heme/copper-type cytochrome/quinol oxidase subunit 2